MRYSVNKDRAEIVKVNHLPSDISAEAMPSRILLTWTDLHYRTMEQATIAHSLTTVSSAIKLQTGKATRCHERPTASVPPLKRHSFEFNYRDYQLDIPSAADALIASKAFLPDDNKFANIIDVQRTALLLFVGYLDAATQMSESCGGGGNIPDGWGRDKDEDDLEWARRCAHMADRMCKAPVKKGLKRERNVQSQKRDKMKTSKRDNVDISTPIRDKSFVCNSQ